VTTLYNNTVLVRSCHICQTRYHWSACFN